MATEHEIIHATWEVLWIENRKIETNDHGRDFSGAMVDYLEALEDKDLKMVTLRCKNIPHPPPLSMADYEVIKVRRKGKIVKVKRILQPVTYIRVMTMANVEGNFWCPYCRRLLPFKQRPGSIDSSHGSFATGSRLACPLCNSSYRLVARWNPTAQRMVDAGEARTRSTAARTRTRRRR